MSAPPRSLAALADPGPWRITFVTCPDECNLSCTMCREHSPLAPERPAPPRRLTLAQVAAVLDGLRGGRLVEVIPSTVGEPLLWRDLPGLAGLCQARGLRLNLTTNGTWPRLGGAGWAQLLAGACSDVKVSWNGATAAVAEALMGGLRFDLALQELRDFLAVRDARRARGQPACAVSFQVTAREANLGELPDLIRLAAALGVERVKVNHLQVHFPALQEEDLRRSPESRRRWNLTLAAMRRAAGEATAAAPVRLQAPDELPEDGGLPPSGPCPFLGREAWITAEGRFAPCPSPAAKEGRLFELGSLDQAPLEQLWSAPAYQALREEYPEIPACRDCALRRPGGS